MSESHPSQLPEQFNQLPKQKLVEIIVSQQQQIQELTQEIERLKLSQNLDSQTSLRFLLQPTYSKKARTTNKNNHPTNRHPQIRNREDSQDIMAEPEKDLGTLTVMKLLAQKVVPTVEINN